MSRCGLQNEFERARNARFQEIVNPGQRPKGVSAETFLDTCLKSFRPERFHASVGV
jgi:hypothetical protein